jgi:hypothetical protein
VTQSDRMHLVYAMLHPSQFDISRLDDIRGEVVRALAINGEEARVIVPAAAAPEPTMDIPQFEHAPVPAHGRHEGVGLTRRWVRNVVPQVTIPQVPKPSPGLYVPPHYFASDPYAGYSWPYAPMGGDGSGSQRVGESSSGTHYSGSGGSGYIPNFPQSSPSIFGQPDDIGVDQTTPVGAPGDMGYVTTPGAPPRHDFEYGSLTQLLTDSDGGRWLQPGRQFEFDHEMTMAAGSSHPRPESPTQTPDNLPRRGPSRAARDHRPSCGTTGRLGHPHG